MAVSNVLISGLKGLGVEIGKIYLNVVLFTVGHVHQCYLLAREQTVCLEFTHS